MGLKFLFLGEFSCLFNCGFSLSQSMCLASSKVYLRAGNDLCLPFNVFIEQNLSPALNCSMEHEKRLEKVKQQQKFAARSFRVFSLSFWISLWLLYSSSSLRRKNLLHKICNGNSIRKKLRKAFFSLEWWFISLLALLIQSPIFSKFLQNTCWCTELERGRRMSESDFVSLYTKFIICHQAECCYTISSECSTMFKFEWRAQVFLPSTTEIFALSLCAICEALPSDETGTFKDCWK
jgi:hypothetical protein